MGHHAVSKGFEGPSHPIRGSLSMRCLDVVQYRIQFIRFPLDNQQLHRIKANFMACRYAGVVGAVDGTHIQIIAPSKDEDVFVNRKKVHSINTQIAFDATFNILDVAKWPAGSTHDPRILMGSGLRREAPCTSWWLSLQDVLTPYLSPQPGAQLKYNMQNFAFIKTQVVRHGWNDRVGTVNLFPRKYAPVIFWVQHLVNEKNEGVRDRLGCIRDSFECCVNEEEPSLTDSAGIRRSRMTALSRVVRDSRTREELSERLND
ncbi:putative nuclease HARBI1 [Merluccius polli]|uniref:Nuclease HARBI1 n=1 Tax=Merluccius polli TaxID=89951 RepID=A0AA47LZX7_MERPO|nr:putative nuclease HARBI1 [Merluccius polli]